MACSKLSGSGPQEEESLTSADLRLCAFCLKQLDPKELKKCGRCHRRAYCSRACQATDWKKAGGPLFVNDSEGERSGVGQGHKDWCGLPYGEEGLDWIVKEKEPKGSERKEGVFALRDLPRFFRIMVEGLKKVTDGGGCRPGHKAPHPHFLFGKTEYEGFRLLEVDHACAANTGLIMDEDVKALILYASRQILAGEEIRMQLKFHNNIFLPIPSPRKYADLLLKENRVVCPEQCVCKDKNIRAKLEELRVEVALLKEKKKNRTLSLAQAIRLLQLGKEVIPLDHLLNLHRMLWKRVDLGAGGGDVLELLHPYMLDVKDFVEEVYHPKRFAGLK